ncbi:cytochrome P450 77A3 [Prunus yedoensis var. nudiflora]|uniref:Cytochrome P450 77A3 n=1 Tax=Prunus yedoensis var. nudiflora TaxID=2094558 RepID=A0A314ZRU9_PRUYE|nr:cytochrome P450 77A3 [Prunus yedoensis var. nudiflora]
MEMMTNLFLLGLGLVFLRLWLRGYRWVSGGSGGRKKLLPGPPAWPVVGNLIQVILQRQHFVFVARDFRAKYGPIFRLQMGQRTLIFVSSADLIHEALVRRGSEFATRPGISPCSRLFTDCDIHTAEYGPLSRTLRRNLITEVINPGRIRKCSWIRNWAIQSHLDRLKSEAVAANNVVHVLSNCRLTICTILTCLCFGTEVSEPKIKMIDSLLLQEIVIMTTRMLPEFFPTLAPFLFRGQYSEARELRRKQMEYLVPLVRKRKAFLDQSINGSDDHDCMTMVSPKGAAYIDSLFELEVPGRRDGRLGEEELVTLCSEVIVAGTDTAATALEWAFLYMVTNQEMQQKVYNEIVECVGGEYGEVVVTESDVEKMSYLSAVVKETFRRHPPFHVALPRAVVKETELGGYTIPADAIVEFYLAWVTQDPDL